MTDILERPDPRIRVEKRCRERRARIKERDPRGKWRGPDERVNRINLMLLCSGFIDSPTSRELAVAALRLSRTGNQAGTGLLTVTDIAQRIGVNPNTLRHYFDQTLPRLRAQRTERRHADAVWRAWHKHGQRW